MMCCTLCDKTIVENELYIEIDRLRYTSNTKPYSTRERVHLSCVMVNQKQVVKWVSSAKQKTCDHERTGTIRDGIPYCDDCDIDLTTVEEN